MPASEPIKLMHDSEIILEIVISQETNGADSPKDLTKPTLESHHAGGTNRSAEW